MSTQQESKHADAARLSLLLLERVNAEHVLLLQTLTGTVR